ncbi:unnamed protein product [Cylindrotheca closterium]|uniref:Endonuclease/exonuclease/phosphatase domain-containing protein n=1 Tax=Cylindrotheca closterium TaxID=2856 RepID=A0AAD2FRK7_9STRA|nr:unnamed protein product [Cylindrotheca closterium]
MQTQTDVNEVMSTRYRHYALIRCAVASFISLFYPSLALSLSPNAEVAYAGETIPDVVLEFATPDDPIRNKDKARQSKEGPFFWTQNLGANASDAIARRYGQSVPDFTYSNSNKKPFSLLTWNILSQKLYDAQIKRQNDSTGMEQFGYSWMERLQWIVETLASVDADIVCLQEVDLEPFNQDLLPSMNRLGYNGAIQGGENVQEINRRKGKGKRAHLVATFWKSRFEPLDVNGFDQVDGAVLARGRTLTTLLQDQREGNPILAVINCHLEGHPRQYSARIKQLQHAMDDLVVRCAGVPLNGLCIAGDFNCELQSSACSTYLRIGRIGRKGGLGGVHGTSANAVPPSLLECDEAAKCLDPILEWGKPIPNDELEKVQPHPFRANSLCSCYPEFLGKQDARKHFTFCARPNRPVAGLDQIWYSSLSLKRLALRKPLSTSADRLRVLTNGLPAQRLPSDHLPIGTILDWNAVPYSSISSSSEQIQEIPQLQIRPKDLPAAPKPKSPIMAFTELDMLLVTCPYDSEKQREELEAIVDDVPDLPPDNQKPSSEQLKKLSEMKERRKQLLMGASESARTVMQRILKLKKEVVAYENAF